MQDGKNPLFNTNLSSVAIFVVVGIIIFLTTFWQFFFSRYPIDEKKLILLFGGILSAAFIFFAYERGHKDAKNELKKLKDIFSYEEKDEKEKLSAEKEWVYYRDGRSDYQRIIDDKLTKENHFYYDRQLFGIERISKKYEMQTGYSFEGINPDRLKQDQSLFVKFFCFYGKSFSNAITAEYKAEAKKLMPELELKKEALLDEGYFEQKILEKELEIERLRAQKNKITLSKEVRDRLENELQKLKDNPEKVKLGAEIVENGKREYDELVAQDILTKEVAEELKKNLEKNFVSVLS